MQKVKIKAYRFTELPFEVKKKLVLNAIKNNEADMLFTISKVAGTKFEEKNYSLLGFKVKIDPLEIEGTFVKMPNEYFVMRENDQTKFYSNEFVKEKTHMVPIHNMSNHFVEDYLMVYRETNELFYLIKSTLEDQYYEILSKDNSLYQRDGTLIETIEDIESQVQEDGDYDY